MEAAEQTKTHVRIDEQPFKREWLKNFAAIRTPGKYRLKSARNIMKRDVSIDDITGLERFNVYFKAVLGNKLDELDNIFKQREEVPRSEVNHLFLSASALLERGSVLLPMKGEEIDVVIDYINGELGVVSLRIQDAKAPELIEVDKRFGPTSEEKSNIVAEALRNDGSVVLEH